MYIITLQASSSPLLPSKLLRDEHLRDDILTYSIQAVPGQALQTGKCLSHCDTTILCQRLQEIILFFHSGSML